MGSIRTSENIAKLTKTSTTILSLPASRINIGASQYVTSALTLNTAVVYPTMGGLDASVTAGTLYYVYAVVSSGTVYLIGSTNSSLPSGFTQARVVGGFTTNSSSQIDQVGEYPGNLAVAGSVSAGTGIAVQDNQNLFINGAFDFWQRNTSFSNAANGTKTADRWYVLNGSGATLAVSQLTGNPLTGSFSRYALRFTMTTLTTPTYQGMAYYPEGLDLARYLNKVCTLSFWVRSSVIGVFSWGIQSLGSGCYPTSFTINAANTWEYKTFTFLLSTPYGTPTVDTGVGCVMWFTVTADKPTYGAADGVWNNTNKMVSNNITNSWVTGSTFDLAEVMFNVGSKPAPFKRAGGSIAGELALCQRYYEKSAQITVPPGTVGNSADAGPVFFAGGYTPTNSYVNVRVNYAVRKRATPALLNVWDGAATPNLDKVSSALGSNQTGSIGYSNDGGFTCATNSTSGHNYIYFSWAADADF